MQALALAEAPITQGTLRTADGRVLPLEHTAVKARLDGPVASVEVQQVFKNDTDGPIEAVYLFPLPHQASVHKMSFRIGARTVQGTVKEREEARRIFAAARREGRSATLLEEERPSLFTLSCTNIPPGEKVEVSLAYQERLAYDEGEWRFVFPLVVAERFEPGLPAGAPGRDRTAGAAQPGERRSPRPPRASRTDRAPDVSMEVEIRAGRPIEPPRSPSHRVLSEALGDDSYRVHLAPSDSLPNRDFVLAYRAALEGVRTQVLFERREGAAGTFLLCLTPPVQPLPDDLDQSPESRAALEGSTFRCGNCGATLTDVGALTEFPEIGPGFRCEYCGAIVSTRKLTARRALPREVVLLVDRSCSMRGSSLSQARRAVRRILEGLGPRDRVKLIAFDHDVQTAGDGKSFMDLDGQTIQQLDAFLEGLRPRGGTELEKALQASARERHDANRTALVVLITDAAVGNEGRLLRRVPEILGRETRLYVLGIGPAVNRYLVDRLARAGGGASDVLLPGEELETVVGRFARRVRQGGPVLRNLRLTWDEALPVDVYPSPIPDLFGGQTVQLLGRFMGSGASRLVLTGTTAAGDPFRQEVDLELPESSARCPGLERLWARLRIDSRLERLATAPEEAAEIRLEVLGLALKHALLSPYTALVAEDSERRVDGPAKVVQVPLAEPAGAPEDLAEALEYEADGDHAPGDDYDPSPELDDGAGLIPPPASFVPGVMPASPGSRTAMGIMRGKSASGGPEEYELSGAAPARESRRSRRDDTPVFPVPELAAAPSWSLEEPAPIHARRSAIGSMISAVGRLLGVGSRSDVIHGEVGSPILVTSPSLISPDSEPYSEEILRSLEQKPIGELDLVFLVDETGSMGPYIEEVKRRLLEIIAAIQAAPLCRSLRLGLVSYRDHEPQDTTFVSRVVPLTDDVKAVQAGVRRMQAAGGGDGPEAVTDGLFDLVRLDWRPGAARVVVWVGDAPPHGVTPEGDGFPDGCPCGHHWFTQAECCREMGVVVHAVGCLPGIRGFVGAEDVFKLVAQTSRGLYLPLSEAPLLIPLITGLAETELDKQRIQERIAEALARHQKELEPVPDQERIRYVTDVLRLEEVRPRALVCSSDQAGPSPLRFRELELADVEEGLERLRRLGRTSL